MCCLQVIRRSTPSVRRPDVLGLRRIPAQGYSEPTRRVNARRDVLSLALAGKICRDWCFPDWRLSGLGAPDRLFRDARDQPPSVRLQTRPASAPCYRSSRTQRLREQQTGPNRNRGPGLNQQNRNEVMSRPGISVQVHFRCHNAWSSRRLTPTQGFPVGNAGDSGVAA